MKTKKTYEISFSLHENDPVQKELLICLLEQCGYGRETLIEIEDACQSRMVLYGEDRAPFEALKKSLTRSRIKGIDISIAALDQSEWQTKWKSDFKPCMVTDSIRIVPAWLARESARQRSKKKDILIDTDVVFGTGTHPTTRFVAQFIEEKKKGGGSFLDIGTGTGILSLVAAAVGFSEIWCYDIEKDAIHTARANFKLNQVCPQVLKRADFKKVKLARTFDFVAANVITDELISMREKIIRSVAVGKYVAVSGISLINYKRFREHFENDKLRCIRHAKQEGWTALLYKRVR
jgi:ribosomal protein L11 methyltransferase